MIRLVLFPNKWSTLENIPCTLEKSMYSAVGKWNKYPLYIYISPFVLEYGSISAFPCWLSVSMIYPLLTEGILKSPPIFVLLSTSPFRSVSSCLIHIWYSFVGCIYTYGCYVFLMSWLFYHYIVTFFLSLSLLAWSLICLI